ncbi:M55 family metallopeptidase [Virgibacillus ndiopensis]|uniref:M55 family metallopeptidase n=1 Tax=Virgibacillus ndiopensis TaxID=2004408 RepID=UPI001FE98A52
MHSEHTARDGKEHEKARMYMTQEINACIEGALEVGASEIIVNDSHGTMRNVLLEHLNPYADLISGSPKKFAMVEGLNETFDAAIFIGYHTRMATNGILNHTFHGRIIQNIRINGNEYGEFGLNAGLAGYFGVPVVMVSGCDLLSKEATELIPAIETAIVKHTINRTAAQNKSIQRSHEIIKLKTMEGIKNTNRINPLIIEGPFEVEISFLHSGQADIAEILPIVKRNDPTSVTFNIETIPDVYRYIRSLIMMVGSVV